MGYGLYMLFFQLQVENWNKTCVFFSNEITTCVREQNGWMMERTIARPVLIALVIAEKLKKKQKLLKNHQKKLLKLQKVELLQTPKVLKSC